MHHPAGNHHTLPSVSLAASSGPESVADQGSTFTIRIPITYHD